MASGNTTVGGITAFLSTNTGVLNQDLSISFGINGAGTDEITRIDDDNIDEVLTVTFSESVFLRSFVTSNGNSATVGVFTAGTAFGAFNQLTGGAAVTTSFAGSGQLIGSGQSFTIQQNSGAVGFSLDSITVTAVPEPSTYFFTGFVGLALISRQHWAKKRTLADPRTALVAAKFLG